jgi:hypothetical protein
MELQCFVCSSEEDTKVSLLTSDPEARTKCYGICNKCSIVVCSGHGRRVKMPVEFLCILCVPEWLRRGDFSPRDPDDPIEPPVTPDVVTEAIAFAPEPVRSAVHKAMTEYLEKRGLGETANLGKRGLAIAAKAFSDASGVTEFLKAIEKERILEGS